MSAHDISLRFVVQGGDVLERQLQLLSQALTAAAASRGDLAEELLRFPYRLSDLIEVAEEPVEVSEDSPDFASETEFSLNVRLQLSDDGARLFADVLGAGDDADAVADAVERFAQLDHEVVITAPPPGGFEDLVTRMSADVRAYERSDEGRQALAELRAADRDCAEAPAREGPGTAAGPRCGRRPEDQSGPSPQTEPAVDASEGGPQTPRGRSHE